MTQRTKLMLEDHLQRNGMGEPELVRVALKSLIAAKQGRFEALIPLPVEVDHYRGRTRLPVRELIDVLRLDGFLEGDCQEYYA